jgi:hypothetical protein
MVDRTTAAGVFGLCCIGFLLAPGEVSARPGGIAAGRGVAIPALPRGGALPLVRPGHGPVLNAAVVRGAGAFRRAQLRRHHRFHHQRWPLPAVGGIYQPYLEPNDDVVLPPPAPTPAYARPLPPGDPVAIAGRICFAQTYIVPSEAGGPRPLTITRC